MQCRTFGIRNSIRVAPGGSPVTPLTAGGETRIVQRLRQRPLSRWPRRLTPRPPGRPWPWRPPAARHRHRRPGLRSRVAGPVLRRRRRDRPDVRPGPQLRRSARPGSPTAARCCRSRAAGPRAVSARRSLNASKQAAITTCSISAPEKPSVWPTAGRRAARRSPAVSPSAGPALSRAFRCSRKITRRSASVGRSMKKISSNRPLRIISGGSSEMLLAVAMTNTGCRLLLHPAQERAEHPGRRPAVAATRMRRRRSPSRSRRST